MTEYERLQLIERSHDRETADLFLNCPPENIAHDVESDRAALVQAAKKGYAAYVRDALLDGADPNTKDEYGSTLLMHAAWGRNPEIAIMLIDAGADPDYNGYREYEDDGRGMKTMILTPLGCAVNGYISLESVRYEEKESEKSKATETIKIILERCSIDTCYKALRTFFDNSNTPGYSKYQYNKPMLLIVDHLMKLSESARARMQSTQELARRE